MFSKRAAVSDQRRERSERWQVAGVGPHDKLRNTNGVATTTKKSGLCHYCEIEQHHYGN
jgi:hypothetical protein